MNQNIGPVLQGEMFSACRYFERVVQSLAQIDGVNGFKELSSLLAEIEFDLDAWLATNWLREDFFPNEQKRPTQVTLATLQARFHALEKTVAPIWEIVPSRSTAECTVGLINLVLATSYDLHRFCSDISEIEVPMPRLGAIQVVEVDEAGLARHELAWMAIEQLLDSAENNHVSISSLQVKREERHREWIQKGHEFIFQKKPQEAMEAFEKASELKETAEVLTLMGWALSQMNQIEKAKGLCLQAIKLDPDYGPPYNDLGTYLLNEGQATEALKWFELAKNASLNQNKEYPFINAGRAYLAKKDVMKALEQFEIALEIAPYHEELKATVAKLKTSVEKQRNSAKPGMNLDERFPFQTPEDDDSPPVF
ncbi:MAG: tetratricopeptide repeat protein [bacterium]